MTVLHLLKQNNLVMKKNGILGCSLGICLTAGISCAQVPEQNRQKPNVLFIIMDDMSNIDGGYRPFARNSSLPEELQAKWQDFEMRTTTWRGEKLNPLSMKK